MEMETEDKSVSPMNTDKTQAEIEKGWIKLRHEQLLTFLQKAESYYSKLSEFLKWSTTLAVAEITVIGFFMQRLGALEGNLLRAGNVILFSIICLGISILFAIMAYSYVIYYELNEWKRSYLGLKVIGDYMENPSNITNNELESRIVISMKEIDNIVYKPKIQGNFFFIHLLFLAIGTELFAIGIYGIQL